MAKDVKPEADGADAPKKGGKKILLILSVLFVLILLVGGGGAYWLFFTGDHNAADEEVATDQAKPEKKKTKETAPVYVAMDAFVVNLVPEHGDQFLQLILSAEVEDAVVGDKMKMYTPKIRNNIMLLLSGKKASELQTKEGKETLAVEIKNLMNEVLSPGQKGGDEPVKDVLFTSFIIQ